MNSNLYPSSSYQKGVFLIENNEKVTNLIQSYSKFAKLIAYLNIFFLVSLLSI
jgi:hypothetical protein